MTTLELPFERSYWADPGKLMAGYYPGEADEAEAQAKLEALLDSGVRHVVNLMKETQHPADKNDVIPYQDQLMSIAEDAGIDVTYVLHPIVDQDIPSREMMKSILDDIDRAIGEGRPVYVHCMGGIGRTGTVVGCYMSRHGLAVGDKAIERIRELRSKDPLLRAQSPNTAAQRGMVRSWKEGE